MAAKESIKWPFPQDIHAQTAESRTTRKWHFLADCTKIRQFLAECAHSENGFRQPLVRFQHLRPLYSQECEADLSVKTRTENQAKF